MQVLFILQTGHGSDKLMMLILMPKVTWLFFIPVLDAYGLLVVFSLTSELRNPSGNGGPNIPESVPKIRKMMKS